MVKTADTPERPDQLTKDFLELILRPAFPLHRVINFDWIPMNLGVISEVVIITVEFESVTSGEKTIQRRFVGKFVRPEFPFKSMFEVESAFYGNFTTKASGAMMNKSAAVAGFPFAIPTAFFTSNVLIVLEYVELVETFTCAAGSPPHLIPMLVTKLAQMHARFRGHNCDGLAAPAGIGSHLTGEEKSRQFPACWMEFINSVLLENCGKKQLEALCHKLSMNSDQLRLLHKMVNNGLSSFIHGDFHIANMLLPTNDHEKVTWLLDWATCGKGNPLRDLAFFFIVSVQANHRREQEHQCLVVYYEVLSSESDVVHLSLDELLQQYKLCVLNQFIILVVLDSLTKSLVANAKTKKVRLELDAHFREVNRRACLSVLDNFGENDLALLEDRNG